MVRVKKPRRGLESAAGFFYLGFIRKWKRHSIATCDQDDEKIREVVTT
jgi:hypothetical protein